MTHTCNSSYSRGRDQEDCGSRTVQEKIQEILSSPIKAGHNSVYLSGKHKWKDLVEAAPGINARSMTSNPSTKFEKKENGHNT